jgi:hypothetical protein
MTTRTPLATAPPTGSVSVADWHTDDDTTARLFDVAQHGAVRAYGVQAADGTIGDEPVAVSIVCGGQVLDGLDVATAHALHHDLGRVLRAVTSFDVLQSTTAAAG